MGPASLLFSSLLFSSLLSLSSLLFSSFLFSSLLFSSLLFSSLFFSLLLFSSLLFSSLLFSSLLFSSLLLLLPDLLCLSSLWLQQNTLLHPEAAGHTHSCKSTSRYHHLFLLLLVFVATGQVFHPLLWSESLLSNPVYVQVIQLLEILLLLLSNFHSQ